MSLTPRGLALYSSPESLKSLVYNLGLKTEKLSSPQGGPAAGGCPGREKGPRGSRRRDPQAEPALGIAPSQARFLSTIKGWILNRASVAPEKPACLSLRPPLFSWLMHGMAGKGASPPFGGSQLLSPLGTGGAGSAWGYRGTAEAAGTFAPHTPLPSLEVGAVTSATLGQILDQGPREPQFRPTCTFPIRDHALRPLNKPAAPSWQVLPPLGLDPHQSYFSQPGHMYWAICLCLSRQPRAPGLHLSPLPLQNYLAKAQELHLLLWSCRSLQVQTGRPPLYSWPAPKRTGYVQRTPAPGHSQEHPGLLPLTPRSTAQESW